MHVADDYCVYGFRWLRTLAPCCWCALSRTSYNLSHVILFRLNVGISVVYHIFHRWDLRHEIYSTLLSPSQKERTTYACVRTCACMCDNHNHSSPAPLHAIFVTYRLKSFRSAVYRVHTFVAHSAWESAVSVQIKHSDHYLNCFTFYL